MPNLSRRTLFAGLAATAFAPRVWAQAQAPAPATPFTLPPLPYGFDANEPHIDAQTMMIHHDRHHATYVANLNAAAKDYPQIADTPLPTLLSRLGEVPEQIRTAVRNSGGGHVNHSMFWTIMGSPGGGKGGAPTGALAEAITREFGSLDQLKTSFNRTGAGVFGSGWVFVTVTREGKLGLTARPNQDTPLMDGTSVLLANDVWEHAYYLKYQNRRPDYLAAWWNTLNWDTIAARYAAAQSGTLTL